MPDTGHTKDKLYTLANNQDYSKLIDYATRHRQESVRFGASGVLTEFIDSSSPSFSPRERKQLIDGVLNDPSDTVRGKITEALLQIDCKIIDSIIIRLEQNPQQTPTNTPYPLILTKWADSQHIGLQYLAVVGFGHSNSQTATTRIETLLIRSSEPDVLIRAAKEAGGTGDERLVTPLQNYLRTDHTELDIPATQTQIRRLKETCVDSLIEIGTDAAYEALIAASRSTDEELKERVIGKIGRFGAKETIDVVVDELDNKDNGQVRSEAAKGVITSFTETDKQTDSDTLRQTTIEQIGEQIEKDVSHEFASIVDESENNLERRNAAWLLGQLGESNNKTTDTLIDSLQSDDTYLQQIAAASLAQLDDGITVQQIESIIETTAEDTEAHKLATYLKSTLTDTAEEAKKELITYTKVTKPSDYTTSRPD